MSEAQLLLAQLTKVSLMILLVGMMWRGRAALCWSFTFYIVAMILCNGLITLAPDRFYWGWFWVLKQGLYDVLKMATAVELAWRAFRAFPGAWRTARWVLIGLLATSTLALAWLTPSSSYLTLAEWQPSVVTATVWLLTSVALLVVFYQIPIGEWHRTIVLGLAPYLLVFVTLLSVLRRHGWHLRAELGVLDTLAFLAVIVYWISVAWRPVTAQAARVPIESLT